MPKNPHSNTPVTSTVENNKGDELFKKVKSDYRWKIFGQSAFVTLSSIFLFGGVGYLLDMWRGKGHLFLIILLVLSYPVTQIALYKKLKDFNPHKSNK